MCAIVGALFHGLDTTDDSAAALGILRHILSRSSARGRDGFGWSFDVQRPTGNQRVSFAVPEDFQAHRDAIPQPNGAICYNGAFISNLRAEPTSEYVQKKRSEDQQPYLLNEWAIVHNGTIANDKELRTHSVPTTIDSAAIVEHLNYGSKQLFEELDGEYATFRRTIHQLVGSYAILATHKHHPYAMMVAANYRPIWYAESKYGVFFASSAEYFPSCLRPVMLEPYSTACFDYSTGRLRVRPHTLRLTGPDRRPRALVVASGGLDSTVAAVDCIRKGMDVELVHFTYGCRAQEHEIDALMKIADRLNVSATLFPMDIYSPSDSRLFDKGEDVIAGGEEGAEYAHEWVPARNLVMLSMATAMAEAKGFDYIVLGNNLEEAGAYPDNEPEFIRKFNQLLPFAVGDGKRVEVLMPVGDLMKHEIVKLGVELNAPLDLTWSCYKHDLYHCGKCGPCFMRKTAFEINGFDEVITYEE